MTLLSAAGSDRRRRHYARVQPAERRAARCVSSLKVTRRGRDRGLGLRLLSPGRFASTTRRSSDERPYTRAATVASIAIVGAAIAAGLFVTGSPAEQRLLRLDEQRVTDLRQLSYAANYRWDRQQQLPSSAADLVDGQYLYAPSRRPCFGTALRVSRLRDRRNSRSAPHSTGRPGRRWRVTSGFTRAGAVVLRST